MASVLFLSGKGFYAKLIRFFTGSDITHVAIRVDDICIHSSMPEGVQLIRTVELMQSHELKYEHDIGEVDLTKFREHLGKPYDFLSLPLAIIGQLFGKKLYSGDKAFICTEFVTEIVLGKPYALSPIDLFKILVTK
jgi:hypothetical protein